MYLSIKHILRFRFGNIVWRDCDETLFIKFQKIQNRSARIITDSEFDALTEPLLGELDIIHCKCQGASQI